MSEENSDRLSEDEDEGRPAFYYQFEDFEHFYDPHATRVEHYKFSFPSSLVGAHKIVNGYIHPVEDYFPLCDDPSDPLFYLNISLRHFTQDGKVAGFRSDIDLPEVELKQVRRSKQRHAFSELDLLVRSSVINSITVVRAGACNLTTTAEKDDTRLRVPSLQLPYPSLIIRPASRDLVEGLTPSAKFSVARANQQAEYYMEQESSLEIVCYLYAKHLHSHVEQARTVYLQIATAIEHIEQGQAFSLQNVNIDMTKLPRTCETTHDIQQFLERHAAQLNDYEIHTPQVISEATSCEEDWFAVMPPLFAERLIDYDELDEVSNVVHDKRMTEFTDLTTDNGDSIIVQCGGTRIFVPRCGYRAATTYRTLQYLQELICPEYRIESEGRDCGTALKNREKYEERGFEDEAGDCKVCGTQYDSYFEHIETVEHLDNYAHAFDTPLARKASALIASEQETCYEYVGRHMQHLEKRSQLAAQLHVIATEIAVRVDISYEAVCRALTLALFELGVHFVVSEVESVVRADSPTAHRQDFQSFVLEQHEARAKQMLEEDENYEVLAQQLTLLRPLHYGMDVYSAFTAPYCTLSPEFYRGFCYSQEQVRLHRNFVNYVEAMRQQAVSEEASILPTSELVSELQLFDLDRTGACVAKLAGMLKHVLRVVRGATFESDQGRFEELERARFMDSEELETFNVRGPNEVVGIPLLQAVYCTEFMQDAEQLESVLQSCDRVLESDEENAETKSCICCDDDDDEEVFSRANSFAALPIVLEPDQISARLLRGEQSDCGSFNPVVSFMEMTPEVVLRRCAEDCLLSLESTYGLNMHDAMLVELRALAIISDAENGVINGLGAPVIPYERQTLRMMCGVE